MGKSIFLQWFKLFLSVLLLSFSFIYADTIAKPGDESPVSDSSSQQSNTQDSVSTKDSPSKSKVDALGDFLWGFTPSNSVSLGMWSWHVTRSEPWDDNWKQQLIGVNYESYYIGTIVNTFDQRGFTAGIRRNVYKTEKDDLMFEAGYNIGVLSGYTNGEGMYLSNYSPVIPFAQIFADVTYCGVGVEFALIPPIEVLSIAGRFTF